MNKKNETNIVQYFYLNNTISKGNNEMTEIFQYYSFKKMNKKN